LIKLIRETLEYGEDITDMDRRFSENINDWIKNNPSYEVLSVTDDQTGMLAVLIHKEPETVLINEEPNNEGE
jgi:hypothetical protein